MKSTLPKGEVQLSKRGLYPSIGGGNKQSSRPQMNDDDKFSDVDIFSWLLFFSDGTNDLISIAEISGISFDRLKIAAAILHEKNLIEFGEKSAA